MLSSSSIWTGGAGELHARNLDSTWETVHLAGCCLLFFSGLLNRSAAQNEPIPVVRVCRV